MGACTEPRCATRRGLIAIGEIQRRYSSNTRRHGTSPRSTRAGGGGMEARRAQLALGDVGAAREQRVAELRHEGDRMLAPHRRQWQVRVAPAGRGSIATCGALLMLRSRS
jgi:hypothetical protein